MISQKDNEEGKLFVGGKWSGLIQFLWFYSSSHLWRVLNMADGRSLNNITHYCRKKIV